MIRKMADNDDDLFTVDTTLNLDEFVDTIKESDSFVMMNIWECISEDDREEAWENFLTSLSLDFANFMKETDFDSITMDIGDDLDDDDLVPDTRAELWNNVVEDYVTDKLYDDFTGIEGSDETEVYRKNGSDFLDKLYGIFKGKHITVYISAEAGEIK